MRSFSVSNFRPLPLLGNPHLQTIVGNLLAPGIFTCRADAHPIDLGDGDALLAHDNIPTGWKPGDPVAILVHGLGGAHDSTYMVRMVHSLLPLGVRTVRLDLRGIGAGERLAKKTYNASCSEDVRKVCDWVHAQAPTSPIALVGMSLGGNIVLKLAGEAARKPLANLACVASVSAPIDLVRCCKLLADMPFYDRYYVKHLVRMVRRRQKLMPELPRMRFPPALTLREFDEMYTAPQGGFASALDYYQRSSSLPLIPGIPVPAFLLTARDDPFIACESYEELPPLPHLSVHIMEKGGHLGFVGWDENSWNVRWAEQRIVDWLMHALLNASTATTSADA